MDASGAEQPSRGVMGFQRRCDGDHVRRKIATVTDKNFNGHTLTPAGNVARLASSGPGGLGVVQGSKLEASLAASTFPTGLTFASVWRKTGAVLGLDAAPLTRTLGNAAAPVDSWGTNRFAGNGTGSNQTTSAPNLGSATELTAWNVLVQTVTDAPLFAEFVNGTAGSTFAGFTYGDSASVISVGNRADGATYSIAHTAEQIATTALSDADRQKLEGYLAWKWDTVAALPGGHP